MENQTQKPQKKKRNYLPLIALFLVGASLIPPFEAIDQFTLLLGVAMFGYYMSTNK